MAMPKLQHAGEAANGLLDLGTSETGTTYLISSPVIDDTQRLTHFFSTSVVRCTKTTTSVAAPDERILCETEYL